MRNDSAIIIAWHAFDERMGDGSLETIPTLLVGFLTCRLTATRVANAMEIHLWSGRGCLGVGPRKE